MSEMSWLLKEEQEWLKHMSKSTKNSKNSKNTKNSDKSENTEDDEENAQTRFQRHIEKELLTHINKMRDMCPLHIHVLSIACDILNSLLDG